MKKEQECMKTLQCLYLEIPKVIADDVKQKVIDALNEVKNYTRESLSDYAHEAWCGWMKYMFSKEEVSDDGTWVMPKWAVERWQKQMNTKYSELPEEEKKSDREEADKMLVIFHKY